MAQNGIPTTSLDVTLLNHWQRDFPLVAAPFDALAAHTGLDVASLLTHYQRLQAQGAISRIGAVFAPGAGGASLLAAMAVPPERLDAVAAVVSSFAGVNHNYEREHSVNLWFVATGPDAASVEQLLQSIEAQTGLTVLRLPMLRPYRIDTGFDLRGKNSQATGETHWAQKPLASEHQRLAALAERGLALHPRPFDCWAEQLGERTEDVLAQLQRWLDEGILSRFGVVVRHHELGFNANAMTVFDLPDDQVDAAGEALAHIPGITLAYRRARAPGWPYNLYCMVHGRDRESVQEIIARAIVQARLSAWPRATLFSRKRYKQTGARRFSTQTPSTTPTTPTTPTGDHAPLSAHLPERALHAHA